MCAFSAVDFSAATRHAAHAEAAQSGNEHHRIFCHSVYNFK
jgi:hypothetical protein